MDAGCGEWERLRSLGEGTFASVYLARRVRSPDLVALKVVDKLRLAKARRTERLLLSLIHI